MEKRSGRGEDFDRDKGELKGPERPVWLKKGQMASGGRAGYDEGG